MKALVSNRNIATRVLNLVSGKSFGEGVELKDIPIPTISSQEILVKVQAVALNPTDFKHIDMLSPRNAVIGCDYAGVVSSVGKEAPGGWEVGDRVAGVVHGGLYHDRGSFAEYLKVDGDLAWKIPDGIRDEVAATYGVSAITAMLALNVRLGFPWAHEVAEVEGGNKDAQLAVNTPTVLIYAATTCAGLFHVQLAKKGGYTVVATASPRSFDLVKRYGADRVFDYRSASAVQDIITAFPNITSAVDCYSEGKSTEFCAKVLEGLGGGKIITLLDTGKSRTPGVEYEMIVAYSLFGQSFAWLPPVGPKFVAIPSDRTALARFYATLPRFINELQPPPIRLIDGGFDGILMGLDELRQGKVSGSKLVVKL
ncbi:hypothetical protein V493_03710 [Pseudogymnoascus sp. VKM F-4281 (FW-2241)]|nr:hypothetical protein V493_03710 [Pseudogymnoascus sp. VKM F-4281 (FW-2241)]